MSEQIEARCVNTIKGLAMDAVQKANSGHPGMPMGMADIATVLWGEHLKFDPSAPQWPDRDRVVLSNGHGSMLLYSMLYLTGTSLTLDDLKNFRQWGSPTAGHPEYGYAPGIETTTGPLGQGIANGVGMAFAEQWLRERFGSELVNHHTYVLAGDGCLMEGVSAEAASLAGHLGLGRLIVLYDDNQITIDGRTDISFSENVGARFEAYGWQVMAVNGHDRPAISRAIESAKSDDSKPTLICCRTVIAHGAPTLADTSKSHGSPLGDAEIAATKTALGMNPAETFAVPDDVLAYFREKNAARKSARTDWEGRLASHGSRAEWEDFHALPSLDKVSWPAFEAGTSIATRKSSHTVLQALAQAFGNLIGGSADLAGSNGSRLNDGGDIQKGQFAGRNIHFGVREHGMAAICNGISLHGGLRPFCATFLVFHDYMRPAVRLAALMHQPVTFVYTHDSIFLGEDGPTHQPIEHLAAMRAVPNLHVVRPADANETAEAWRYALERNDGPTALCLTRQGLPTLDQHSLGKATGLHQGAYILSGAASGTPEVVLVATGSEVALALKSQKSLLERGIQARVVSMPCWEAFDKQDAEYRNRVLPPDVRKVAIEAGSSFGWHRYVGNGGGFVTIDHFGASAPASVLAEKFGLTVEAVVETARQHRD
ncbi:MAG: transketolase [Myxococcales bacterium]|nr:transketolase [Myxococcales bacterium]